MLLELPFKCICFNNFQEHYQSRWDERCKHKHRCSKKKKREKKKNKGQNSPPGPPPPPPQKNNIHIYIFFIINQAQTIEIFLNSITSCVFGRSDV